MAFVYLGVTLALGLCLWRATGRRERRAAPGSQDVRWSEVYNVTEQNRPRETGPGRSRRKDSDLPDYYCLLGVPENASQAEIERRYRALAAEIHPDRFFGDPVGRGRAERRLKQLNEAIAVLRDPARRCWYDAVRTPWPIHTRLVRTGDQDSYEAGSVLETAV